MVAPCKPTGDEPEAEREGEDRAKEEIEEGEREEE